MKRAALISAVLLPGVLLLMAGIDGSKHDFSNESWSEDDKCGACHTPHRETPPKTAPLWDPQADLTRTFGTSTPRRERTEAKVQVGPSAPGNRWLLAGRRFEPGLGTLLCLRCHDGALASDMVPSNEPPRYPNTFHPGARATGHGRSDHPVGVRYPELDRRYRPSTEVLAAGAVRLPDGYVECLSCHDPHNETGQKYMLVMTNSGSALCLTCHRK